MTDDYGNTIITGGTLTGTWSDTPKPAPAPRYAPIPVQSVKGLTYRLTFEDGAVHISSARTGTPMETITLPEGMLLMREVR